MAVLAIGVSRARRQQDQSYYFIRRADDDPMVLAGPEPATTGSKDES
jgi:hypothetical protein